MTPTEDGGRTPGGVRDVVVIGSGAAGLAAAIAAADAGATVTVLEKADTLGGASAVSGGALWVPCNHLQEASAVKDSADDALRYLKHLTLGRVPAALLETFVDQAHQVAEYLDRETPLDLALRTTYPDYYPELPGARSGGRSLDPAPFDTNALGPWQARLRTSPVYLPITAAERDGWGRWETAWGPEVLEVVEQRLASGVVTLGAALVAALVRGCLDRRIEIYPNCPVKGLSLTRRRVVGVKVEQSGRRISVTARRAVVLASGGFEWSRELVDAFLPGPPIHPLSPPSNEGDGLRMAMAVGADLAAMSEAWWFPVARLGDERYDGAPLARMLMAERCLPGSLMVNGYGRRFVNESNEYNALGRAFHEFDPARYRYRNVPAYLVFDGRFRARYSAFGVQPALPDDHLPDWMVRADSLPALAERLGLPVQALTETIERFNAAAAQGRDPDFSRGESGYDRFEGDRTHRPSPALAPLDQPPYYALAVWPGVLGTKGGPRIDTNARVLDVVGTPIPGLYAAGNVAAAVSGPSYPGAGATLSAALTLGFIAGRHAMTAAAGDAGGRGRVRATRR
jgi:succinate dehydrogenase/fumarate reductase flavoprotein subunit